MRKNVSCCVPQKKEKNLVWSKVRVSKWWHNFLFWGESNLLYPGPGHKAHANVIVYNVCPHIRRLCCPFPLASFAILFSSQNHFCKLRGSTLKAAYHTVDVCIFLVCVCGKRFWFSWVYGFLLIWWSAFSLASFGSIIMAHFKDWTSGTTNRKCCLWGLSASGPLMRHDFALITLSCTEHFQHEWHIWSKADAGDGSYDIASPE